MWSLRAIALGAALVSSPALAGASDWAPKGVYVGSQIGASFPTDTDFGVLGTSVDNEYDTGYAVGAVIGYEASRNGPVGLRYQLEMGYQEAEIDSHTVRGTGSFGGSDAFGETSVFYGFASVFADFEVAPGLDLFAGAGGGIGFVDFDNHGVSAVGTALDDNDEALGYHLDLGASYDLTPNWSVVGFYRWKSFVDAELTAVDGTTSDVDVSSHNANLGIRYRF